MIHPSLFVILGFLTGLSAIAGSIFILNRFARRRALRRSLRYALYLIKLPRTTKSGDVSWESLKSEIAATEQLFSALGTSGKDHFVVEVGVHHVGEEIHFYCSVPRKEEANMMKQVQGLWADASVEEIREDYNIFTPHGVNLGAYLSQKQEYALPIRTYGEIGADTAASVFGGFAKLNEVGEGAALQILVRPAKKDTKKKITSYLEALKRGESFEKVVAHQNIFSPSEIIHALNPKEEKEKGVVVDEDAVKALETKAGKPLFEVNVRIVASGPDERVARDVLDGIAAGFTQFSAPRRNEFKIITPRNSKNLLYQFTFRDFAPSQIMILTAEEIASFYHLPVSRTETPRVKWLKAKEAPPPSNLPTEGLRIGVSSYRGEGKPVFITADDARRHLYAIGQTGSGKSTFLGNLAIEDVAKGRGIAVIDPHGDLVETILGHIPDNRMDDVIYFNPGDLERPLGLNMIEWNMSRPEEKTFLVNEMQGIFNKLFPPETMGPMFEQYMRNALLLLMEDSVAEPATLIEVPRIFTDAEYRKRKLARITNPVVVDFWEREAVKAGGEASLANMTPYITSKFNNFISNDYVRPIIAQPKSAFNFREAMDAGKIILVNLSKGKIGDINAGLLGMIITGKILIAALSRADVEHGAARRDFRLYIDEFQNFTTDSISTILSEARKYGLSLVMAHQFIAQLTEKIRDAVFGNVGSMAVFRVGVQDAEFLVKQFEPVFNQNDLTNIDNLNAYVKLLIRGETSRPFNIKIETTSWAKGDAARRESMRERSRTKYGADRGEVEAAMYKRLRE